MADVRVEAATRLIGTLFGEGSVAGLSDGQLLDRFVSQRDAAAEHAFSALVRRHGPMVLGVCRGALGDRHDAEEAFQATFLVLARKASSLREPGLLGPWLHGVARRTALKVRARRPRTQQANALPEIETEAITDKDLIGREDAAALHEEIGRLPDQYRTPVVLCYFEGLTHEEAARRLGWPVGTVGVRLSRARERLRERLARRGLAPAGSALFLVPRAATLGEPLATRTTDAALGFAFGTSSASTSPVAAIAVGVLRNMTLRKLTLGALALVACSVVAVGSAAVAFQAPATPQKEAQPAPKADKVERKSILANGGIEAGDSKDESPAAWQQGAQIDGVEYLWDRTNGHQGSASLHLKKSAQRYFPIAQWFQVVDRSGTTPRLKVAAFVKAQSTSKAILDVQFLDADDNVTHQWAAYIGARKNGEPPVTHDWKRYEGVVEIPEGTKKLIIAPQIYGPGEIWFDDITAEYTTAPATDATAVNPR